MRFGPTSIRVGGVLAKGLRRPKVRPDLKASRQTVSGETSYVIKIPDTEALSRISEVAYELLQLCDGTRTVTEIAAVWNEIHPSIPFSEEEVIDFVDGMDPNTFERSQAERNLMVLEKIRDERKKRVDQSSLLYMYFSAWDPDKFLERIHPYFRWMFTRQFVYVCIGMFILTAAIVVVDWPRIRNDTIEFYNFANKSAYDLLIFWLLMLFITAIHEFGHGLTCKHFGGEVHQMGLMLMYFMPVFFTDCTDMAMFDRSSKRAWTILGGVWIELVACAVATFAWFLLPPGTFLSSLCYQMLLLTGVSGVFINLNPLMKLDGYYLLREYVQIENLRERSFDYLKQWVRRHTYTMVALVLFGVVVYFTVGRRFGLIVGFLLSGLAVLLLEQSGWLDWIPANKEAPLPSVGLRKHRIFLGLGLSASAYGAVFLIFITFWFKNIFTSKFGDWGYLITAWLIYMVARRKIGGAIPSGWLSPRAWKEKYMAWRMTRAQQVGGVALLVLLAIPTSITVPAEFVLEPGERAEVRAVSDGWVKEVKVQEGQEIEAGAVLAVLSNPELETRAATLEQERALAERRWMAARATNDMAELNRYQQEARRLGAALEEARRKREALTLRAPLAGTVTTPQVEQRVGEYLAAGEVLAVVADRRQMRARVLVRDWELEDVAVGARVKLNVRAYPFRSFSGTVRQILPAAAPDQPVAELKVAERHGQQVTNHFAVVLEIPNPDGALREGMTGTAKILGSRYPTVWRIARSGWRLLSSQVW